MGEELSIFSQN